MSRKTRSKSLWRTAVALLSLLAACEKKPAVTPDQVNAAFAKAKAAYDELMKYNPSETMTYNYRNLMTQAEQARAKGDLPLAESLANQAADQAVFAVQVLKDRISKSREKLDKAKDQIEQIFPVNRNLIQKYWQLDSRFRKRDYDNLEADVDALLVEIEREQKLSIMQDRSLLVYAPQEYIKQFGNVRIYKEVTPQGKLKEVVDTVPNGAKVKEVRIMLFSPELTFYYVQTGSGTEGWMAAKYLIGEDVQF